MNNQAPQPQTHNAFNETGESKIQTSFPHGIDAEWINYALLAGGVGLFTLDIARQVIYPSEGCCELFGLPFQPSYPTQVFEDLVIKEDRNKRSSHATRSDGTASLDVEYRIARADTGEVRVLERRATLVQRQGEASEFVGAVRDITAQRRAEEEARLREHALETFSQTRAFIVQLTSAQRNQTDPDKIMRLTSKSLSQWLKVDRVGFFRLLASDRTQYVGCYSSESLPVLRGVIDAALFGERSSKARSSGHFLSFSDSRHDPSGGLEEYAQQGVLAGACAPLQSDKRWHAGMFVHHGSVRTWSESDLALIEEVASLAWQAVERAEALMRLQDRVVRQQGLLAETITDTNRQRAGREAAESKVRQLQKMEAVSMLTGGIAHDFNNMLAVVMGSLTLIQRKLAKGQTDITRQIDLALDGAKRASVLTGRLMSFSRQQPLKPEPVDVNRLLAGMSDMLSRSVGESVQLETIESAGLWLARADAHQLENVLLNLVVNARDAMPDGGRLTIETANAYISQPYAEEFDLPEGQYVKIAVSDTGCGMSPEVLDKAFDPFFTTKPVGKGSGLGLSQVYGFASQSGGHVRVYSEVGLGTTFKIYLPRHLGSGVTPDRTEAPSRQRHGVAEEVVMVVEDDDRMRSISVEVLRDLGYTVLHAASGPEALSMLKAGQQINLLFTDIVMPEMTGRELADQALKLIPKLKIVFTTGYTRNAVVHNGTLDPGTHLLTKPFTVDELARIIGAVLDEEPPEYAAISNNLS